MADDAPDPEAATLLGAGAGRERALGEILDRHRRRLLKMVHLRMDPRLRARLGASDVLQDAYVDASRRLPEYLRDPRMPFFLWLRFLTAQRLAALHRRHILASRRDASRDVRAAGATDAWAASIADVVADEGTTPSEGAVREELRERVMAALDGMDDGDRRVLVLRHFEELTNAEAARELEIEPAAASKRYVRALRRLGEALGGDVAGAP
jgi:RNA polymerase sigma-70 factor, ECF subfamily